MRERDQKLEAIQKAYALLGDGTPYEYDCGEACDRRCCQGDQSVGMWLLPGEEALLGEGFTFHTGEDGQTVAVCSGSCNRESRPFACRIFPLFPQVTGEEENWKIRAALDPRAMAVCPIAAGQRHVSPKFRRGVRRAARVLLGNEELKQWLLESCRFLDEIARLEEELREE